MLLTRLISGNRFSALFGSMPKLRTLQPSTEGTLGTGDCVICKCSCVSHVRDCGAPSFNAVLAPDELVILARIKTWRVRAQLLWSACQRGAALHVYAVSRLLELGCNLLLSSIKSYQRFISIRLVHSLIPFHFVPRSVSCLPLTSSINLSTVRCARICPRESNIV